MKVFRFFFLCGIGVFLWSLSGCNDSPDPIGSGTQPSSDYGIVQVDTFYATSHSTVSNLIYTSSIDRFMIGKYLSYQAWACLKFSSFPDSLLGSTITHAEIILRPFYNYGSDTTSSLSLNVFRAGASLQGDSLTYDSLDLNGSHYYANIPINVSMDIDSLYRISLDTSVVREWFISNTDTTDRNDGIILQPTGASTNIKGFYSCNSSDTAYLPFLYVRYIKTTGQTGSYIHKTGSSKYLGHVDPNLMTSSAVSMFHVQNGVSYRGLLSFDNITLPWPIQIHRAVMQITLDSATSSSKYTPFTYDLIYGLSVGTDNKVDGLFYTLDEQSRNSIGQRIYQFNVLGMTSRWIKNTSTRKFAFSGYFESGSFDLFTFYGSNCNTTQRPKIIITYSIKR